MNNDRPPDVLVGTSGWSYPDWVGPFYPEKTSRGFSRLTFYADFLDCVEVNSTFYRHFTPDVGEKWLTEVDNNPGFVFIIKLFREFTHGREYEDNFEQNRRIVLSFLEPFIERKKLGGVLVQFSEFFRDSDSSRNKISRLFDNFANIELFLELRHGSWYSGAGKEFVKGLGANVVAVDEPALEGMVGFDTGMMGRTGYIRLHGRNAEMWKESRRQLGRKDAMASTTGREEGDRNARYNYLYSGIELDEIEKKILAVKEKCERIYVVANNHPMGKAVANALELIKRVRNQERVRMPETVIKYFPELEGIALKVNSGPESGLFE